MAHTTVWYLLVILGITTGYAVEDDGHDGSNIMEEEYITNDDTNIRDPIVKVALRIFHSLEDFSHEHPKHAENLSEKNI